MKDYSAYTFEDFLQNDSFRDWILGNEGADASFWESFQRKYPEKKSCIDQAALLVTAIGNPTDQVDSKEIRGEIESFLSTISDQNEAVTRRIPRSEKWKVCRKWATWIGAAGITFFLVSRILPNEPPRLQDVPKTGYAEPGRLVQTANNTEKPIRIVLSDNSEVWLSPNSTMSYPAIFPDSARSVYLAGEASFSVKKGLTPFMVFSGEVVTKVLGTRFVVKAFEKDKNTTVQVQSGTVSVFRKGNQPKTKKAENNALIITANQAAVFEKKISQLTKTLVADPIRISDAIPSEVVRYDEMPLNKILVDLEQSYGIAILYDKEQFSKCKITATLTDESMYQKLEMLSKSVGATYEIVDGRILIHGTGCP